MKTFHLILILGILQLPLCAQSKLVTFQDKLIGLTPDTSITKFDIETSKTISEFWKIFKDVRNKEIGLESLKGITNFGFIGNNSESSETFRINGGITLTKGTFPEEFEFSTLLNIQINDGELQENLSNLRISYDRFIGEPDNFSVEAFSFINRRRDEFLGVNQRYEIGGGLILAFWRKKLYKKSQKELNKFSSNKIEFKTNEDQIIICKVESCTAPLPAIGITEADSSLYAGVKNRIKNSIIKENSPLRIGMLAGVFFEVENISVSDSLMTNSGMQLFEEQFKSTTKLRWEIRPTLDFRLSDFVSLKVRPYIKLPMPWDWDIEVEGEEVVDLRVEFPILLNVDLADNFTLSVNYTYYYDNAPNSIFKGNIGVNDDPLYLTANQIHHYYNFAVGYKFK